MRARGDHGASPEGRLGRGIRDRVWRFRGQGSAAQRLVQRDERQRARVLRRGPFGFGLQGRALRGEPVVFAGQAQPRLDVGRPHALGERGSRLREGVRPVLLGRQGGEGAFGFGDGAAHRALVGQLGGL